MWVLGTLRMGACTQANAENDCTRRWNEVELPRTCSLFVYLIINYVNIQWCRYAHLILQEILAHPKILVSIISNCLPLAPFTLGP
jgi:hypothetical protein